nr:10475_t:CDS:2 [Entrophospora candida]
MSNFLTIKRSNDIKYDVIIEVDGHGEGLGVELKLKKFTSKECFDLLIIYKEFDLKDDNNELIDKLQNHIIEKFREYIEENIVLTSETIFLSEKFKKLQNYWSDLICAFPSQLLFDNSSKEKNFTIKNYKNTKLQESSADTNYYNKRVVRDDVIDYKKSKRKSKIFKIKL